MPLTILNKFSRDVRTYFYSREPNWDFAPVLFIFVHEQYYYQKTDAVK